MNQRFIKMILLASVIFIFGVSCKSHKKATSITNAGTEKSKVQSDVKSSSKEAEADSKLNAANEDTNKVKLGDYFTAIANANNIASANSSIDEALSMFASPLTPVLIVISEEGGQKDYDRPTSIKDYLNYLKDQKKNLNKIENLKMDESGKITEIELRKN